MIDPCKICGEHVKGSAANAWYWHGQDIYHVACMLNEIESLRARLNEALANEAICDCGMTISQHVGGEDDELVRAAHRIIKRLPETQLEVELEEVMQERDELRVKLASSDDAISFLVKQRDEARIAARTFWPYILCENIHHEKRFRHHDNCCLVIANWLTKWPWLTGEAALEGKP